ncbi:MAG TPA: hypothetical protein VNO86_08225 [Candidatus Binatia bacterium]|nr:hypothetical protein [Candidatus Binatia bacterium]
MHTKRRFLTYLVSVALVVGQFFVPVRTPIGQLGGPRDVRAACNVHKVYSDANKSGYVGSFCVDDPDLRNNQATPFGWCAFLDSSWNDCISSVEAQLSGSTQICLWEHVDYGGSGLKINPGSNGWWNMPSWLNDKISSIEIANSDCFPAGNQS